MAVPTQAQAQAVRKRHLAVLITELYLRFRCSMCLGSSKTGVIAGIAGGLVVLLGVIIAVCVRCRKNRGKATNLPSETYISFNTPNHVDRSDPTTPPAIPPVALGLWTDPAIVIARIPLDKVDMGALISQGGYGQVYRGTYKGQIVAIKVLQPARRNDMKQDQLIPRRGQDHGHYRTSATRTVRWRGLGFSSRPLRCDRVHGRR